MKRLLKTYLMPDGTLVNVHATEDVDGREWIVCTPEEIDAYMLSAGAVRVDEVDAP